MPLLIFTNLRLSNPSYPIIFFSGYNLAQYEHLPIYKKAFDLQVFFERIVKNFGRYHKYTHGTALRNIA